MVIIIHLCDDGTQPPGHFLPAAVSCCPTKEPGNTSMKARGDPHLPLQMLYLLFLCKQEHLNA